MKLIPQTAYESHLAQFAKVMDQVLSASRSSQLSEAARIEIAIRHTIADLAAYVGATTDVISRGASPADRSTIASIGRTLELRMHDLANDRDYIATLSNEVARMVK